MVYCENCASCSEPCGKEEGKVREATLEEHLEAIITDLANDCKEGEGSAYLSKEDARWHLDALRDWRDSWLKERKDD